MANEPAFRTIKPDHQFDDLSDDLSDDLAERVASAMWEVYVNSSIAREGSREIRTWGELALLAGSSPQPNAAQTMRDVGLEEARQAIAVVRQWDAGK